MKNGGTSESEHVHEAIAVIKAVSLIYGRSRIQCAPEAVNAKWKWTRTKSNAIKGLFPETRNGIFFKNEFHYPDEIAKARGRQLFGWNREEEKGGQRVLIVLCVLF